MNTDPTHLLDRRDRVRVIRRQGRFTKVRMRGGSMWVANERLSALPPHPLIKPAAAEPVTCHYCNRANALAGINACAECENEMHDPDAEPAHWYMR